MTDEHPSPTAAAGSVMADPSPSPSHDPAPSHGAGGAHHMGEGDHGAHPKDSQYVLIALILAAITALEVGVSYMKGLGDAAAPMLLILAGIKFVMVVMFFMHLRFDNRVFRRFFVTGLAAALVIYVVVFFTMGVFSSTHGAHG